MKNKSKLAKFKKEKQIKNPQVPGDWLYLNIESIELSVIKDTLKEAYSVEYWEEVGVLEVELETEKASSVDFETVDMKRADEVTADYLQKNSIKTVFLVSISPEYYDVSKKVMEKVIEAHGGYFCGDTADFTPVVK